MTKPMGSVNLATRRKLRERYKAMWGREWPHDDEYLKTLWRRAVAEVKMDHAGFDKERYDVTLNAMRENHEFEEPSNERLAQAFNDSGVFKPFICVGGKKKN